MKLLITPSLVDSYYYYQQSSEENAKEQFLNFLNKVPFTNDAIKKGIAFENKVLAYTKNIQDSYSYNVIEAGEMVKGGIFQVRLKKDVVLGDFNLLLYGKADVIKQNCVYDLKYKSSAYKLGSYTNKTQHLMYMYLSGIHNFKYLIATEKNEYALFVEDYSFTKKSEQDLFSKILIMLDDLFSNEEFKQILLTKWNANYKTHTLREEVYELKEKNKKLEEHKEDEEEVKIKCNYCNKDAVLTTGKDIFPHIERLWDGYYYSCVPCGAYVGCHKDTKEPLGMLANKELRIARINAHKVFDVLWKSKKLTRSQAYKKLAEYLNIKKHECHIALFDIDRCNQVIEFVESMKD